jgi:hypothetical protein
MARTLAASRMSASVAAELLPAVRILQSCFVTHRRQNLRLPDLIALQEIAGRKTISLRHFYASKLL